MSGSAKLDGRRALVTGGSRGLGLAICDTFARQGARVAFTYAKNDDDAELARTKLGESGAPPLVFRGSVADAAHVKETVARLVEQWGGIDILVNNVGPTQILPVALVEEDDWDEIMNTNVKGAYLFSRAVLKTMIRARAGHILNIGTFASERVIESPIHYAAAKSALRGLTEALAREVGRYNIRVNLLAPGLLEEGLAKVLPRHRLDEYLSQCALGRLGTLRELAETAAFLVSDDNSFMSGAKICVDGGL